MERKRLTVVTGGSSGIGAALVQSFLQESDVLNISRRAARSEGRPSHVLHNLRLDLQDVGPLEHELSAWLEAHPAYDVETVIHNAATLNLGKLDELGVTDFERAFRVNVFAALAITSVLHRSDRLSRAGARVVYVGSSLGRQVADLSFAGLGIYSATKAALARLAMVQRREFELSAPHVEVLRIHPGVVDTEIQRELRKNPNLDLAFAAKTEALPPYEEGAWRNCSPKDDMRTVPPALAAEFIMWAVKAPHVSSDEYDFYCAEEFHAERSAIGVN